MINNLTYAKAKGRDLSMAAKLFCMMLVVMVLVSFGTLVKAQSADASLEGTVTPEEATEELKEAPKFALGSLEVMGGWPGYQLYGLRGSLQFEQFGLAMSASYQQGLFFGLISARYYTPLPIPIPTYISLGAGFFDAEPVLSAAFGMHIPLGLDSNFRLNLEGGVHRSTIENNAQILPSFSIGLSYTFTFDATPTPGMVNATNGSNGDGAAFGANCTEIREPDRDALDGIIDARVERFVSKAQVTYAGVYSNFRYSYNVGSITISGNRARVSGSYNVSLTEVATGTRISGSGRVEGTASWTGCGWSVEGYDIIPND